MAKGVNFFGIRYAIYDADKSYKGDFYEQPYE